jgi:hypothetical protein
VNVFNGFFPRIVAKDTRIRGQCTGWELGMKNEELKIRNKGNEF